MPEFCCETYKDLVDMTNDIMTEYNDDSDLAKMDDEYKELARDKNTHKCRKD